MGKGGNLGVEILRLKKEGAKSRMGEGNATPRIAPDGTESETHHKDSGRNKDRKGGSADYSDKCINHL
jgi:hypothetical protein